MDENPVFKMCQSEKATWRNAGVSYNLTISNKRKISTGTMFDTAYLLPGRVIKPTKQSYEHLLGYSYRYQSHPVETNGA